MTKLILAFAVLFLSISCATIHSSAEKGDLDSVKDCLKEEINVDKKDEKGATPLMLAVKSNNPKLVSYLIDKGADVNAKDKDGYTPIMYTKYMMRAILFNDATKIMDDVVSIYLPEEILEEIFCFDKKCSLDRNARYDFRSTYWRKRSIEKAWKTLPEKKKRVLEIIKTLLDKKADINAIAKDNDTVLNYAIRFYQDEVVTFLLKNGADADFFVQNAYNKKTNKPFLQCSQNYIIEPYIKKNRELFCKKSAFCHDITYKCLDTIDDPDFVKDHSFKLMHTAIMAEDLEMIDNLLKRGTYLDFKGDEPEAELFVHINEDGSITVTKTYSKVPVFDAVRNKKIKSLNKLIELGANINIVNFNNYTPLIVALIADRPNGKIIKTLIDSGSDLDFTVDNKSSKYDGMNVMQIAAKRKIKIKIKTKSAK